MTSRHQQGGRDEVHRINRSDRVPVRAARSNSSVSTASEDLQGWRSVLRQGGVERLIEGAGSGDPALDVMAAGVALNLSDELGGF